MTVVALIGLGEVGTVLAEELGPVAEVRPWDIAVETPYASAAEAVHRADLVISAVTAASTLAAAESATALAKDAWFLDVNSASPSQKQAAAAVIERAGGRYVEAAVMSPIEPKRLAAPMLLGGPHAAAFAEYAEPLGFAGLEPYADTVGPAAATKLCRSVVIKGVESLLTESMLTARAWGVEERVLGSLSDLLPAQDWTALAEYMISRSVRHGTRRAEELREAARTVAEAGVDPLMAEAIARRQDWTATHRDAVLPLLDVLHDKGNLT
ncbi:NAD(P)-dependent oxidoreductase [Actinophytocola sp.]|uniref:NAD(P)-dependent oxidoreductase n=1 Tax=Actinophytocola sp. TaxID=1872138 RepID=UPI0025C1347E|nr:DUF1932 domain-containing protein [Actinophytocola sp.]